MRSPAAKRWTPPVAVALLVAVAACGESHPPAEDILEALRSAPGVSQVVEQPSLEPGDRTFFLTFRQPVDHFAKDSPRFSQFVSIVLRDRKAPVLFLTNGYYASRQPRRGRLEDALGANQVTVEHRFFDPSSPHAKQWSRLTIEQAAADHHRIVRALRPILTGRWISIGASKGGMTAVYHRWQFPDDVEGTVAYVAPQSYSPMDPDYVDFLERVGTAECRARLRDYQRTMLERREEVKAYVWYWGLTFDLMGEGKGYDVSVLEFPFTFWQYGGSCDDIPGPGATVDELARYMSWIDDTGLPLYQAYYYQSATQLGGPAYPQGHLADFPGWPIVDHPADYPPFAVAKPWDDGKMREVGEWVRQRGTRMLFVFGDMDPWSTHMFEPNPSRDVHRFVIAGGNHSAGISLLPEEERAATLATLGRWAGVTPLEWGSGLRAAVRADETRRLLEGEPGLDWADRHGSRSFAATTSAP